MSNVQVDGAHEGIRPSMMLKHISRGEIIPVDEGRSLQELERAIREVPLPDAGVEALFLEPSDESYDTACMAIAHCFLTLLEGENPPPLESEAIYTEDEVRESIEAVGGTWSVVEMQEVLEATIGSPKEPFYDLYEAVKERWPNCIEYFGGASGMMIGWAYNAVRAIKGYGAVENPAIIAINEEDN